MFAIRMRALCPERNVRRQYEMDCWRDLLGDLVLEVRRGRIGNRLVVRQEVFHDDESARHRVRELLTRRRSAPKRIGVPYETLTVEGESWLAETRRRAAR